MASPEFTFKKGEIAMELLEGGNAIPLKEKSSEKVEVPSSKQESDGSSTQTPGILSGSALGITAPEYPESSRRNGEEGEVIVAFELDSEQKLVSAKVEKSSSFEDIDNSALKAVESHYNASTSSTAASLKRVRFVFRLAK